MPNKFNRLMGVLGKRTRAAAGQVKNVAGKVARKAYDLTIGKQRAFDQTMLERDPNYQRGMKQQMLRNFDKYRGTQ